MTLYPPIALASAYLEAGQTDEALATLTDALASAPDDDIWRFRAGILARLPGRHAEAAADLARIAAPTLDDDRLRARLLAQGGQMLAACTIVEALWRAQHDVRDAEMLVHLLLPLDAARALSLLTELPDTWNWQIARGDAYASLGDAAAARAAFASAQASMRLPEGDPLWAYVRDRLANLPA